MEERSPNRIQLIWEHQTEEVYTVYIKLAQTIQNMHGNLRGVKLKSVEYFLT